MANLSFDQYRRLVLGGCGAVLALCLISATSLITFGAWQSRQQLERQAEQVEMSVRVTLPRFCRVPGQTLTAQPVSKPIRPGWPWSYPTRNWTVTCYTPHVQYGLTQIRVYGESCEMTFISPARRIRLRQMAVCP